MEAKGNQIKGEYFGDVKTNAEQQLGSRPGSAQLAKWNRLLIQTKKEQSQAKIYKLDYYPRSNGTETRVTNKVWLRDDASNSHSGDGQ